MNGERDSLRVRLLTTLDGERYRLLLTRLRFPPRFRPGVDDVPLDRVARKEFRRLARKIKRAGSSPDDSTIHGLRITLKRTRYAAELSSPRGRRDAASSKQRRPCRTSSASITTRSSPRTASAP